MSPRRLFVVLSSHRRADSSCGGGGGDGAGGSASEGRQVDLIEGVESARVQIVATGSFIDPEVGTADGVGGQGQRLHHRSRPRGIDLASGKRADNSACRTAAVRLTRPPARYGALSSGGRCSLPRFPSGRARRASTPVLFPVARSALARSGRRVMSVARKARNDVMVVLDPTRSTVFS